MNDASFPPGTSFAPAWALAVGMLGKGLVVAATVLFLVAFASSLSPRFERLGRFAFYGATAALVGTMASLGALFLRDQFEFAYVFNHSDSTNPAAYKFASIWTSQEGSFLLWGVTSSIFGSWAIARAGAFARHTAATLGLVLASVAAILHFGTPFDLLKDVAHGGRVMMPPNGAGMTPALQNYWVVIHPPTIFSGFGLLAVPFGLAVAGLLKRDLTGWIVPARPFILWGVAILGLGISLGGLWAYETQGWGGFWAWDPVENVSLVPWLFMIALAHSVLVQARTGGGKLATLALGLLPFLLFVYGTFLTRSGLLEKFSVHAFVSMEGTGLGVLKLLLVALAVGFVAAMVAGWKMTRGEERPALAPKQGFDRSQGYAAGILLLSLIGAVVALGMSWPVINGLTHLAATDKVVEEPHYHRALLPFFIPLVLLMAITPFATWRTEGWSLVIKKATNALAISLAVAGFGVLAAKLLPGASIPLDTTRTMDGPWGTHPNALAVLAILVWLCLFVATANALRAIESARRSKLTLGGFVSHFGIAVLLSGLIISHGLERKDRIFVRDRAPGQGLGGYTLTYRGITGKSIYDRNGKVQMTVTEPDGRSFPAELSLYYFDGPNGEPKVNTWPHIERSLSHDVYVALREPITEVFAAPLNLKPGETKEQDGLKITYKKMTMVGEPGQPGTRFGALLDVEYKGKTVPAHPELEITPEGLRPSLVRAGSDFNVAMTTISPADQSVGIQALLSPPVYPVELFEKPLTSLVWIGTFIFTFGGAMSALARRARRTVAAVEEESEPETVPTPTHPGYGGPGATLPAPQS